jgi:hypothetical protein
MPGKDSSRPLGMTMPVISNEVRDLSLILFSKENATDTKVLRSVTPKLRGLRITSSYYDS